MEFLHSRKYLSFGITAIFITVAVLFFLCPLNFTPRTMSAFSSNPPCHTSRDMGSTTPLTSCFDFHLSTLNSITEATPILAVFFMLAMIIVAFWYKATFLHSLIYSPQRFWRYKSPQYHHYLAELQFFLTEKFLSWLPFVARRTFVTVLV